MADIGGRAWVGVPGGAWYALHEGNVSEASGTIFDGQTYRCSTYLFENSGRVCHPDGITSNAEAIHAYDDPWSADGGITMSRRRRDFREQAHDLPRLSDVQNLIEQVLERDRGGLSSPMVINITTTSRNLNLGLYSSRAVNVKVEISRKGLLWEKMKNAMGQGLKFLSRFAPSALRRLGTGA